MIILFDFPTPERDSIAVASALPAGAERALRLIAATNEMPRPRLLWSGNAADTAFDRAAFATLFTGIATFIYDDSAPAATRIVRVQK